MSKMTISSNRCKQCGLCVENCPRKALRFGDTFNNGGYKFVVVDEKKCIVCGICYTMCPDLVFQFA